MFGNMCESVGYNILFSMDRLLCSKLALKHFSDKQHTVEYEKFLGNKFEFKTYEVQVAVFGDNFNEAPIIKTLRVRLSDEEYLLLMQWQLQNPNTGFNACYAELSDISVLIECQVEEKIFGDNEIGTYAIYLSEVREDVATIQKSLQQTQ